MGKIRRYERPKLVGMSGRAVVSRGDCWYGDGAASPCHYGDWATGTDCYYGHWNVAGYCHNGFGAACQPSTQCTGGTAPGDCKSGGAAALDCYTGLVATGNACCNSGTVAGSCGTGASR